MTLFFTAALKRLKDDDESEEEETIVADAGGCGVRSSASTKVMCERAPDVFFFKKEKKFCLRDGQNFGGHLSDVRKNQKKILVLGFEGRWAERRGLDEREREERRKSS